MTGDGTSVNGTPVWRPDGAPMVTIVDRKIGVWQPGMDQEIRMTASGARALARALAEAVEALE